MTHLLNNIGRKAAAVAVAPAAALTLGGGRVAQARPQTTMNGHPVIPLEAAVQWQVEGTNFWTAPR